MTRCSGSRKTNFLFNLINQQQYIDKICLHGKSPYEARCQTGKYRLKVFK